MLIHPTVMPNLTVARDVTAQYTICTFALGRLLRMQMENLVHDLPVPVNFEQRKEISEPVTSPVVQLQPHSSNRINNVDAGDSGLEVFCRSVLVIPVKKLPVFSPCHLDPDLR